MERSCFFAMGFPCRVLTGWALLVKRRSHKMSAWGQGCVLGAKRLKNIYLSIYKAQRPLTKKLMSTSSEVVMGLAHNMASRGLPLPAAMTHAL